MDCKLYIPVTWIYEQIKEHPGMHAASWNYLLDLWDAIFSKQDILSSLLRMTNMSGCTKILERHMNFGKKETNGK